MLANHGIKPKIIEYLKIKLSLEELQNLKNKLALSPQNFLRKNDAIYKEMNLDQFKGSDNELFEIIIKNPRILERPIIVSGERAVIGRPPENILKLL